jgi:hypothetical protein
MGHPRYSEVKEKAGKVGHPPGWCKSVKKKKTEWKWARFHPIRSFIQPYRDDFTPLMKALKSKSR